MKEEEEERRKRTENSQYSSSQQPAAEALHFAEMVEHGLWTVEYVMKSKKEDYR